METILLPSPLILEEGTMLVQGIKDKGSSQDSKKEEKEVASIVTSLATSLESVLTRCEFILPSSLGFDLYLFRELGYPSWRMNFWSME